MDDSDDVVYPCLGEVWEAVKEKFLVLIIGERIVETYDPSDFRTIRTVWVDVVTTAPVKSIRVESFLKGRFRKVCDAENSPNQQ